MTRQWKRFSVIFSRISPFRVMAITLVVSVLVKIFMALILPMTGDEAYFIVWGNHLDYGYYDHPPMVGWWLSALLQSGDHPLWLRLPNIIVTTLLGWLIYRVTRQHGEERATFVAALYLLTPVHLLLPFITTDVPLILFAFLSALAFYQAQQQDRMLWYLLAGVLLGLAYFSKFFAGMLGVAYLLYVIVFVRRGLRPYLGIALVVLGTLPFIGLNLYWNYQTCWNNYLFNLVNRTSDFNFSIVGPFKYLLLLLYLVTPPIAYYLWGERNGLRHRLRQRNPGLFLALFLIPIALFVGLSFGKSVGLHWLLSFYPFLFIALAALLSTTQLQSCFKFMCGFSLVHLIVLLVALALLPQFLQNNQKEYQKVALALYGDELAELVNSQRQGFVVATPSYSESAVLAYHLKEDVLVFGHGSYHGRQMEINTDWSSYNGKGIAILSKSDDVTQYAKYFSSFVHIILPLRKTRLHLGLGIGFNYELYNSTELETIRSEFYRIPDWLPSAGCYMYERK